MHPRTEVIQSGKVRNLDVTESLTYQGTAFVPSAATDEKSKVSSNDTTAGYLNGKLVAGTNITLTENNNGGNETLTISAAGGGGGTTGFTPTQNVAAPNATINASRLLVDVATSSGDAVLQPKGFGAVMAQLPDSTDVGGNKRGSYAVDWQMHRATAAQVATGNYSVVLGGSSNTASQDYSVVGGRQNTVTAYSAIAAGYLNQTQNTYCFIGAGQSNTASGDKSVIVGGQNNLSSGTHSSTLGGIGNTASGQYSIAGGSYNQATNSFSCALGGDSNTATGLMSSVLGGQSNSATGAYSAVIGGNLNTASGENSIASGFRAVANAYGMVARASGRFATNGDAQVQEMVMRCQTTNATLGELTSDGLAATTSNTIQVPLDGILTYDILLTARHTTVNGMCAAWALRGAIDNNAGVIAMVGNPTITIIGDDSGGVWVVSAENSTGRLALYCIGQLNATINWVAHVRIVRVVG